MTKKEIDTRLAAAEAKLNTLRKSHEALAAKFGRLKTLTEREQKVGAGS